MPKWEAEARQVCDAIHIEYETLELHDGAQRLSASVDWPLLTCRQRTSLMLHERLSPPSCGGAEDTIELLSSFKRQRISFGLASCVLPMGCMFLRQRRRLVSPIESLILQGIDINCGPEKAPVPWCVRPTAKTHAQAVQSLAGNAFSAPVAYSVVIAALLSHQWGR